MLTFQEQENLKILIYEYLYENYLK